MTEARVSPPPVDPRRHPAALAAAIARAWRPYRWRAYAAGAAAGLVAGGVAAPILTTSLLVLSYLAGNEFPVGATWANFIWSAAFVVTFPLVGATLFARWQPLLLRDAAETYVWLALEAERDWARLFGATPVPRDAARIRAFVASVPETPETALERFGLWLGLLEFEPARAAATQIPDDTPENRYHHAAADWLLEFVAGTTTPVEPLRALAEAVEDEGRRVQATVLSGLAGARVALAEGRDWRVPLAAERARLPGPAVARDYARVVWRPTFRRLMVSSVVGAVLFWLAVLVLQPLFPLPLPR